MKRVIYPETIDSLVALNDGEGMFLLQGLGLLSGQLRRTEEDLSARVGAPGRDLALEHLQADLQAERAHLQRLVEKLEAADCVLVLPSPRA